ncbi:internalin [Amycolatopsis azurea DSM 43854]|uniref:Internalin n=1 Tax=Amycolatopsis azurea DSM 43854 TaxID=1238180 RepID=M2PYI1_9PSEU|nr:internalin, putative [Amycolatopsis azurea DSM 43854]OOC07488.1 internalin [Amycolatopsis azurea DSM 43854]
MVVAQRRRRAPKPLSRRVLSFGTVLAVLFGTLVTTGTAQAATWPVQGENDPSTFDCDHLYYSNFRSGMQFRAGAEGAAEIQNTVISKRAGGGPPDYWSTNMAMGKDPDTGRVAAFYSSYTTGNLTLYKHVSGTNTVTDEIAAGESRKLPAGVNWGGLGADPASGMLYGAQNGGAPVLFAMNLASGATKTYSRGSTLKPVPANDPVFTGGSLVPDLFVDSSGGVYYGIVYGGQSYIYRFDPDTGETTQAVKVTGPGSSNGFNNYGMAFLKGSIYLGYYGGALYKVDPRTGVSQQVPGGNAHTNQVGRITSESGGTWPITDLASCSIAPDLTKRLVVAKKADRTDAKPGDKVTYTVTVANEGTATAPGTVVTDDLTGVVDDAAYNDDAKALSGGTELAKPRYDAAGKRLTWTGDVGPGATVTITYSVTIGSPPGGDKKLDNVVTVPDSNCAEGGKDPDCAAQVTVATLKIVKTSAPAKPMPGQKITYTVKLTNDGTADWADATAVDDLSDVVDDAAYNGDATATAGLVTYSATDKTLRWTGAVGKGGTVTITYSVTVANPPGGNKRLTNAVVGPDGSTCPEGSTDPDCGTDEPINAVVITKSAAPDTAKPGDVVTYTLTARTLDGSAATGVKLTDDLSGVVDDATYNGDAVAKADGTPTPAQPGYDSATTTLTWTGDIPAGKTVTITYSVKVGTPPAGDKVLRNAVTGPGGSTCPPGSTDPACGTVTPIGALEIKKTASPASAMPGDKVTYTVSVRNVGPAPYPGASFTDDLTGVLDDATWNGDASATSGGTTFDEPGRKLTWTGDVAAASTVTVTYSVTVGKPPAGDRRLTNVVVGPDGSTCPPGGSDPDCATETPLGSLVLAKTAAPASAKPGQVVTYTVTASNPGTGVYRDARFTDDLSGALDDATYNRDARASAGTVAYAEPKLTWTADLPAGATVTITYSVTVNKPPAGDRTLRNAVTGPDDSTCPPGSADPDCSAVTPVAALKIAKTAEPSAPRPGERLTYTVRVENTGTAAYPGARLSDDLTGVLDDATYNDDATATGGTTGYEAPVVTWTGDVAAGATVTITYSVTVNRPPGGDKKLTNAVVGTPDGNCPPDSADPDCGTVTPVPSLKIRKTATPEEVKTGDTVTYTVTVENVGAAMDPAASFTDDLSGVLDDATYNGDAKADTGTVTVAVVKPSLTWTGSLAPGDKATITYSVVVTNKGDKRLVNVVTGTGSNCEEGSEDPDCRNELPTPALRITKSTAPAAAAPGGKVTYTVVVRNTGQAPYPGASFTDDLTKVLDDATYNQDAKATAGTVAYTEPKLTWTGTVAAGASVTVTYSVTVAKPVRGDHFLDNAVTSDEGTNCPPSGQADPACSTRTPVLSMVIAKSASPSGSVAPGGKVTYTLSITNTGTGAYDDAVVTDDLGNVLSGATYNGDAKATSGSVALTGKLLRWHGKLAVGQKVVVTYSVTAGSGEGKLRNAVTSTTPGANCRAPDEPGCSTETPVTPGEPPVDPPGDPTPPVDPTHPVHPPGPGSLASTGSHTGDLLALAFAALLAGAWMLRYARRRAR